MSRRGTVRIVQYCIYIFVGIVALALAYSVGHVDGSDEGHDAAMAFHDEQMYHMKGMYEIYFKRGYDAGYEYGREDGRETCNR